MSIIYEPKGKALEYSPLAANIYSGCSHGCSYCYVPGIPPYKFVKDAREHFYKNPEPRKNIISQLEKSCIKFKGTEKPCLLSFTSDPYQPIEKKYGVTHQAISLMGDYKIRPQILTKGGLWAIERDGKIHKKANTIWAATLTTDIDSESVEWEPGASLPEERIEGLKKAKSIGLETWVSFEPVINPEAVYRIIEKTHKFVDLYKVGKLNYHPFEKTINWREFGIKVSKKLTSLNKDFYLKKDLLSLI